MKGFLDSSSQDILLLYSQVDYSLTTFTTRHSHHSISSFDLHQKMESYTEAALSHRFH